MSEMTINLDNRDEALLLFGSRDQFLRMIRAKPHLVEVPVAIVTGDYFLSDPIQHELKTLGASIRFKPLWLEDLVGLARKMLKVTH